MSISRNNKDIQEEGDESSGEIEFEVDDEQSEREEEPEIEDQEYTKKKVYKDEKGYWHKTPRIDDPYIYETEEEDDERKLIFFGQLEAAAGALYQLFLKVHKSPETSFDIVSREVLSKDIEDFVLWGDAYDPETNTINNQPILPDGSVKCDNINKKIKGLEALGVIAWFLGENDMHRQNFGLREKSEKFRAIKFDHGKTFAEISAELIFADIFKIFSPDKSDSKIGFCRTQFPKEIVNGQDTIENMFKMVYTILHTDFSFIEQIIQTHISDDFKKDKTILIDTLKERYEQLTLQAKNNKDYLKFETESDYAKKHSHFFQPVNQLMGKEVNDEPVKKRQKL